MFEWDNRFSVNISIIDEEHKIFFLILRKLKVVKQGISEHERISDALNEMTLYALSHFKNEEEYMKKFDYHGYRLHKEEHSDFLKETVGFCNRIMNRDYYILDDLLEYLEEWMVKHIQGTDKKLTKCFNKNGLV